MSSISKTDHCMEWSILALLPAYQEYLVTFKLMTSQVVQRARLLMTYYVRPNCSQGVKRSHSIRDSWCYFSKHSKRSCICISVLCRVTKLRPRDLRPRKLRPLEIIKKKNKQKDLNSSQLLTPELLYGQAMFIGNSHNGARNMYSLKHTCLSLK